MVVVTCGGGEKSRHFGGNFTEGFGQLEGCLGRLSGVVDCATTHLGGVRVERLSGDALSVVPVLCSGVDDLPCLALKATPLPREAHSGLVGAAGVLKDP